MIDIKNKEIVRNFKEYYLSYFWGNYDEGCKLITGTGNGMMYYIEEGNGKRYGYGGGGNYYKNNGNNGNGTSRIK